jgi:hypothetical protein
MFHRRLFVCVCVHSNLDERKVYMQIDDRKGK